jgi:hypothetical protein
MRPSAAWPLAARLLGICGYALRLRLLVVTCTTGCLVSDSVGASASYHAAAGALGSAACRCHLGGVPLPLGLRRPLVYIGDSGLEGPKPKPGPPRNGRCRCGSAVTHRGRGYCWCWCWRWNEAAGSRCGVWLSQYQHQHQHHVTPPPTPSHGRGRGTHKNLLMQLS